MYCSTGKVVRNALLWYNKLKVCDPISMTKFKKTDVFSVLILGEIVAWFLFSVLKNLGLDTTASGLVGAGIPLVFILGVAIPFAALGSLYLLFLINKRFSFMFQLGKFFAVGAANTAVDFGILNFLILISSVASGVAFPLFKAISFIVAVGHSYFWNKFWTFKSKEREKAPREFLQFFIVSIIGLFLNVGIASFFVNLMGPQFGVSEKLWANIGTAGATLLSMVWNFLGYKFIVFKEAGVA